MEATLAGPLSPVVLAVGAAVATSVIVVGVIAGPGTLACIQRGDFGQCMNETFLGGEPVATAEAETDDPVEEDVAAVDEIETPDEDAAEPDPVAEPQEDEAEPEPEAEALVHDIIEPTFELVRVEPDGSAVMVGTASPEAEIQIFIDEDMIGAEIAESSGDWVYVTEQPLPPGGVELRVRDAESDTYAETSIIVVVQDDRESEPLVIAAAPGEASDILQGADPIDVAQADPAPEPAADPVEDSPLAESETFEIAQAQEIEINEIESTEPEAVEPEAAEPETAVDPEPATPSTEEPAAEEIAAAAPQAPEAIEETPAPADPEPVLEDEPATGETPVESDPALTVPETEDEPVQADAPDAADAIEAAETTELAAVPPADETPAAPEIVLVPPSIDAVEIDGDRNFFAGGGTDGYPVRLYVDNQPVATTTVDGGRWLIESIGSLTEAAQRVRIDMLNPDGSVAGRAEVNFVFEMPEPEGTEPADEPIVVAQDPDPVDLPEPVQPEPEPAVTETAPTEPEAVDPEPAEPEISAPEAVEPDEQTTPETPVEQPAQPQQDADEPFEPVASESATPEPVTETPETGLEAEAVTEPAAEPETVDAPETETPVADEPAASEAIEDAEVPTLVGVSDGERVVSGRAIIRRGDNLWTISRRVYGQGIRYTQIYEANTDQIRNPHLIYPGQVFDLPQTDMVIGEDDDA